MLAQPLAHHFRIIDYHFAIWNLMRQQQEREKHHHHNFGGKHSCCHLHGHFRLPSDFLSEQVRNTATFQPLISNGSWWQQLTVQIKFEILKNNINVTKDRKLFHDATSNLMFVMKLKLWISPPKPPPMITPRGKHEFDEEIQTNTYFIIGLFCAFLLFSVIIKLIEVKCSRRDEDNKQE